MAEVGIDISDLHSFFLSAVGRLALVEAVVVVAVADLEEEASEAADLAEAGKGLQ
jgi:hypothetical protein